MKSKSKPHAGKKMHLQLGQSGSSSILTNSIVSSVNFILSFIDWYNVYWAPIIPCPRFAGGEVIQRWVKQRPCWLLSWRGHSIYTCSVSSGCQGCAEKQAGYKELGPGREGGLLSHQGEVREGLSDGEHCAASSRKQGRERADFWRKSIPRGRDTGKASGGCFAHVRSSWAQSN